MKSPPNKTARVPEVLSDPGVNGAALVALIKDAARRAAEIPPEPSPLPAALNNSGGTKTTQAPASEALRSIGSVLNVIGDHLKDLDVRLEVLQARSRITASRETLLLSAQRQLENQLEAIHKRASGEAAQSDRPDQQAGSDYAAALDKLDLEAPIPALLRSVVEVERRLKAAETGGKSAPSHGSVGADPAATAEVAAKALSLARESLACCDTLAATLKGMAGINARLEQTVEALVAAQRVLEQRLDKLTAANAGNR